MGEADVALLDHVVNLVFLFHEFVDVGLEEVKLQGVDCLEECLYCPARNLVIQRVLRQVLALNQGTDQQRDPSILGRWFIQFCCVTAPETKGDDRDQNGNHQQGTNTSTRKPSAMTHGIPFISITSDDVIEQRKFSTTNELSIIEENISRDKLGVRSSLGFGQFVGFEGPRFVSCEPVF